MEERDRQKAGTLSITKVLVRVEFKEYFWIKSSLALHQMEHHRGIFLISSFKKRPDDRKNGCNYDQNTYLDTGDSSISYEDFVNKELIHFKI